MYFIVVAAEFTSEDRSKCVVQVQKLFSAYCTVTWQKFCCVTPSYITFFTFILFLKYSSLLRQLWNKMWFVELSYQNLYILFILFNSMCITCNSKNSKISLLGHSAQSHEINQCTPYKQCFQMWYQILN